MQGWDSQAWLKELTMPTLVLVGDMDRSTTPEDSFILWKGIPNAEFCIMPGCAHGPHLEEPEPEKIKFGDKTPKSSLHE